MPAKAPVELRHLGGLLDALNALRDGRAAVGPVEERQLVGTPAENGDAEGLEHLGGRAHVEDRLRA